MILGEVASRHTNTFMADREKQRLGLEQSQQLRLLPMQVQVGRLLEMNSLEIEEEVKRALDELPALESATEEKSGNEDEAQHDSFNETAEEVQRADYASEDDMPVYHNPGTYSGDYSYEAVAVNPDNTLWEFLIQQLGEQELSETDYRIAQYIIGCIDDNGYMTRSMTQIADDLAITAGVDVTPEHVRELWQMIRGFEPAGVGAVDLRDCLLLQLKRKSGETAQVATEIIADYFDFFSKKHYSRIVASMGISEETLRNALALIQQLNPKPGGELNDSLMEERSRHIIPDFSVETEGDKITLTLLNNIPELRIEESFSEDSPVMSQKSKNQRETRTFVRRHREEARRFINLLALRQETLFNVMSAIVKLQRDFFLTEDKEKIRPMILKDVAALTGYDLSVISRATAGKYVATPHGVYPLKIFFNERPNNEEEGSSHEIMASLRRLIDGEEKSRPLTDEALTRMLNDQGHHLARRTVAKYRERMGIPVARLRKEL